MKRALTMKNLKDKKHKTWIFDGLWGDVIGQPTTAGIWLIYGAEKNGKSTFALMLAQYLSGFEKVLYMSAEEGLEKEFIDAAARVGLDHTTKNLLFTEYESLDDLDKRLKKQKAPKVVLIDNATVYQDELSHGRLVTLKNTHPNVLFVLIAHEERGQPYTAPAQLAKKLAKIYFRVQGLAVTVGGRCPGGILIIDENKAMLYHGAEINEIQR